MFPTLHLTDLLLSLQPKWWHRIMRWLGLTHEALEEWGALPCPCVHIGDYDAGDAVAA